MKASFNKIISAFLLMIASTCAFAQETAANDVPMADEMRSNGKIYVVVTVMSIIFIGLIIYLISIDRKIRRIEKETINK